MTRIARRLGTFGLAATLAVALQGCNSGSSSNNITQCTLPTGISAALVYPAPNTTGNNPNVGQVVVATNGTISTSWNVILIPTFGAALFGSTIQLTSPPFPTPNQVPSFPNPTYYNSLFSSSLPSGTSVAVQLNDTSSSCSPGVTIGLFGT